MHALGCLIWRRPQTKTIQKGTRCVMPGTRKQWCSEGPLLTTRKGDGEGWREQQTKQRGWFASVCVSQRHIVVMTFVTAIIKFAPEEILLLLLLVALKPSLGLVSSKTFFYSILFNALHPKLLALSVLRWFSVPTIGFLHPSSLGGWVFNRTIIQHLE